MTAQYPALSAAEIDLSDTEFWGWPLADRRAAFAVLRAAGQPPFFAEPETPFAERGPGYYALVRHADVVEASRRPEVFSSGRGATSIPDLPPRTSICSRYGSYSPPQFAHYLLVSPPPPRNEYQKISHQPPSHHPLAGQSNSRT